MIRVRVTARALGVVQGAGKLSGYAQSSQAWGLAALLLFLLAVPAPAVGADEVVFLPGYYNGPSNRINIAFLGDGYTQSDIDNGTYSSHVQNMVDHLFKPGMGEDVFVRYQKFFNVFQVNVVSDQAGAGYGNVPNNTALGAVYNWQNQGDNLLYIDESKANAHLNSSLGGMKTQIRFVAVNDTRYGGGGGNYTTFAGGNANAWKIGLHELGHSFGNLADEYDVPPFNQAPYTGAERPEANLTKNWDPNDPNRVNNLKWRRWYGYVDPAHPDMGPIGAYQGGGFYAEGLYRPSENSKMRNLDRPFDAVGREQMILSIYDQVRPLDGWLNNDGWLRDPTSLWVKAVDPNVQKIEWLLDGKLLPGANSETLTLKNYLISGDWHWITANVYDSMIGDWLRTDVDKAQQSVTWRVYFTVPVPEPSVFVLLATGLVTLGVYRLRRRGKA